MSIYLGIPIDKSQKDPFEEYKRISSIIVEELPWTVIYNPLTAFINAKNIIDSSQMEYLIAVNNAALDAAALAVFIWNGQTTYGVPVEIQRVAGKKPIVLWNTTEESLGIYLRAALEKGCAYTVDTEEKFRSKLSSFSRRL